MSDAPRYAIRLSRRAHRYYNRVTAETATRLDGCFEALSRNSYGSGDIRPVQGAPGLHRYRVGGLRVI